MKPNDSLAELYDALITAGTSVQKAEAAVRSVANMPKPYSLDPEALKEALLDAGVAEEKARAAASAVARYQESR